MNIYKILFMSNEFIEQNRVINTLSHLSDDDLIIVEDQIFLDGQTPIKPGQPGFNELVLETIIRNGNSGRILDFDDIRNGFEFLHAQNNNYRSKIKNAVKCLSYLPEIMKEGLSAELFNYGHINFIYALKGKKEPLPLAFIVASRIDGSIYSGEENPSGVTKEKTIADHEGLKLVQESINNIGLNFLIPPTVTTLGLYEEEDFAMMVNEGAGKINNTTRCAAAEVNLLVSSVDNSKSQIIFNVNILNTESSSEDDPFYNDRKISEKIFAGDYKDEEVVNSSNRLGAGYVSALTQVHRLTGRIPKEFHVMAGDGVLINDGNQSNVATIQLITLRGGLSEEVYSDKQFFQYLKDIEYKNVNVFSEIQIQRGIEDAYIKIESASCRI